MNTTLIFSELLIIGIQGSVWLFLLVLCVFDFGWLQKFQGSLPAVWQTTIIALGLSFFYLFGIILDRFSNDLFRKWDKHLKNRIFPNYPTPIGVIRFELGKNNEQLNSQLEYTRSRMRIARASTLNILLITFMSELFISTRLHDIIGASFWNYFVFILFTGVLLTLSSAYAWRKLTIGYLDFVKANFDFYEGKQTQSQNLSSEKLVEGKGRSTTKGLKH